VAAERAFEKLLAAYLQHLEARHYSHSMRRQAEDVLPRLFLRLGEEGIADARRVTEAHLVGFARDLKGYRTKAGRPLAVWSERAYLVAVRRFFAFLRRQGSILLDPARDLPLPRADKTPRQVLSEAQARRLMNAPDPWSVLGRRDRAILETFYGTGVRLGECVRLDLMDLDLSDASLLVRNGKGRKDRIVPVPGRAASSLELYLREARPALVMDGREVALFLGQRGSRLGRNSFHLLVQQYGRRTSVPFPLSPHLLRHACATHLLRGGADIRHVQLLLGHSTVQSTQVYTRVDVEDLRQVVSRAHPRR
jgi:integrase/recombinase XerD